jgi:hypothetical protein
MKIQTIASNRRRLNKKFTRAAALYLLALLAVLSHSQQARAQWTAPDAAGNTATTGAGRVGIGIATPSKGKLHVALDEGVAAGEHGIIYASRPDASGGVYMGYRSNGTAPTGGYLRSTAGLPLFVGTNATPEAMVITNTGDVSIGSAPTKGSKFEVHADLGVAAGEHGLIYASRADSGTGGVYLGYRANGTAATGGYLRGLANLPLFVGTTATPEAMVVSDNGSIGIGTTTPASKLHVVGDITVTGNINAKYQDVAEWVPSTQKLSIGTVVVVDSGATNQVLASSSAYDTGVAGVITGQPGLLLGEGGEGKVKVATTGRVKVRVDATRAPVRAGDLLVTSDVPGVAMRSEPVSFAGVSMHRPGTIIGKALEPLAKGTGEILVLLSLQ